MAVTLTVQQLAHRLRLIADPAEMVEEPQLTVLTGLLTAATALVVQYAPNAPDAIQNEGATRLAGYLYDVPPGQAGRSQNPIRDSGAMAILSSYRVQRAYALDSDPTPPPAGALPTIRVALGWAPALPITAGAFGAVSAAPARIGHFYELLATLPASPSEGYQCVAVSPGFAFYEMRSLASEPEALGYIPGPMLDLGGESFNTWYSDTPYSDSPGGEWRVIVREV